MKESCISTYTGKPRSCYETYEQAQRSADYMKMMKGLDFYPYKCNKCGFYHLALQQDKINFSKNKCSCTDSDGNNKNLYQTYEDALKAKSKAEAKRDVELEIYKCPEGDGWHLTHKRRIRPISINSDYEFGFAVFIGIVVITAIGIIISL